MSDTGNAIHDHGIIAALRADLSRAQARAGRMEAALRAVDAWRGLDGDGITDPVREQVKAALAGAGDGVWLTAEEVATFSRLPAMARRGSRPWRSCGREATMPEPLAITDPVDAPCEHNVNLRGFPDPCRPCLRSRAELLAARVAEMEAFVATWDRHLRYEATAAEVMAARAELEAAVVELENCRTTNRVIVAETVRLAEKATTQLAALRLTCEELKVGQASLLPAAVGRAREEERERCAKEVERLLEPLSSRTTERHDGAWVAMTRAAAAIRAQPAAEPVAAAGGEVTCDRCDRLAMAGRHAVGAIHEMCGGTFREVKP